MKTLFLLRHAKSDWAGPALSDFERPLNARGRKAARAMGREFRRLGLAAERILASPAARVVETLERVAEGYGGRMPVEHDQRLYLASPETLLDFIHAVDDQLERLLIVGHNPGLEQLVAMLARGGDLRSQATEKYPTGTLARIALPAARWRDVAPGGGTLDLFLRPRDMAPDLGPDD
jgi:phosphohistidine phosphatase